MNLDKVNQWLTLLANLGVLIGIIVVAIELQQTQTEMRAESATMRAQMAIGNSDSRAANRIYELVQKIDSGQILTIEEEYGARNYQETLLRYFENIHYQYELGVLDEQIWQANNNGISRVCDNSLFKYLYPDGRDGVLETFRTSFTDLVFEPCKE
ncbi:MAG: hypothetical protein RLP12_00915 [Ekhidna sp.]